MSKRKKNRKDHEKGVVAVYFEGSNSIRPITDVIQINLPSITTTPGQKVKLDAFATFHALPLNANLGFTAAVRINLYRDSNYLTSANEGISKLNASEIFGNPSLTWVDSPPAGTHNYYIIISLSIADSNGLSSSSMILNRSFTAMVFN